MHPVPWHGYMKVIARVRLQAPCSATVRLQEPRSLDTADRLGSKPLLPFVSWLNPFCLHKCTFSPRFQLSLPSFINENGIIKKNRLSNLHYRLRRCLSLIKTVQFEISGQILNKTFIIWPASWINLDSRNLESHRSLIVLMPLFIIFLHLSLRSTAVRLKGNVLRICFQFPGPCLQYTCRSEQFKDLCTNKSIDTHTHTHTETTSTHTHVYMSMSYSES